MKKIALRAAVAAFSLAATASAFAEDVTFTGFAHGSETVNFSVPSPTASGPNATGFVNAGGFATTLNGGASFTSYCVDLYQLISFNTLYPEYTQATGSHVFANSSAYADLSRLYGLAASMVTNSVTEAAFQIAVWEIAYETGGLYNTGSGVATFTGGTASTTTLPSPSMATALDTANSWLAQLGSAGPGPGIGVLDSVGANGHQDVIYAPVPEPSTIALMLGGLVGVASIAKRRAAARRA